MRTKLARAEAALRDYALAFPETYEEFPWGERAIKVRRKVFLFMSRRDPAGDPDPSRAQISSRDRQGARGASNPSRDRKGANEIEPGLRLSVKLPRSSKTALKLPFAEPTGYGLGKSGWVTATFGSKDSPPIGVMQRWIEESYRAIAPKKLLDQM